MITMEGKYRFEDFGFDCMPGNEDPIMAEFENKTLDIPNMVGLYDMGTEIKTKPFSYQLTIDERHWDVMQRMFRNLIKFLLDPYGHPREIKIIRDYEEDKFYKARLVQSVIPERLPNSGTFTLPLIAYDPWSYLNVTNEEIHWGNNEITFDSDILLGTNFVKNNKVISNKTIIATVNGYAQRPPFHIKGSARSLTITANGKSFSLPSFTDAEWIITGKDYTVLKNSQNAFMDLQGDWIELLPGHNEIVVTGTGMNLDLYIPFRDKFM